MRLQKSVIILLAPVLLVLGSVRLLVTDSYLAYEYAKSSFPADPFGFEQSQRLEYASSNFRYVREKLPIEYLAELPLGSGSMYNSRELKHMQDVQNVYHAAWLAWQVSLVLFMMAVLLQLRKKGNRAGLGNALAAGGGLTAALLSLIGLLAVIAWRAWFVAFHQIFFAAGTWTFEHSDTLIRLFPEQFWYDAALTITGISLAGGLLLVMVGWLLQKRYPDRMPLP
jgi:integral membrane protein (TIGR01906 family)